MIYENQFCSYDDETCIFRVKDGIEEFSDRRAYYDLVDFTGERIDFFENEIYSIVLPDSMKILHKAAFSSMDMSSIELPDSIELIEEKVFSNCVWLTKIVWPSAAKSIKKDTFFYCDALEEVSLPEGLLTIEDEAFAGCESLKKIVIPSTVENIGENVFMYCEKLKEIYVPKALYDKYGKDYFKSDTSAEVIPYNEPMVKNAIANLKVGKENTEIVSDSPKEFKSFCGTIRTNLIADKRKK